MLSDLWVGGHAGVDQSLQDVFVGAGHVEESALLLLSARNLDDLFQTGVRESFLDAVIHESVEDIIVYFVGHC